MKPWQIHVNALLTRVHIAPVWGELVPRCSCGGCPHYDEERRCRLTGSEPGKICEPAVVAMGTMIERQ